MSKLYYEIDLSAVLCHFRIKINDVELISMNIDGQTRFDVPINHLILESGLQNIEAIATPIKGATHLHKDAYIRYRVNVFDMSTGDYVFVKQLEEYYTPKAETPLPFSMHKSTFTADVPYVLDAWQKSGNIKDAKLDVKEMLISEYRKIAEEINKGQYDRFIERYAKREQNNATALYLSNNEAKNRISKLLYDFKNGFTVQPIIKESVVVEYSAYGKLACLKRINGLSALYLENAQTEEELVLEIAFHIPEGKTTLEAV